jgi:NADH:ubiquinone oxidoreductase subunit F (NADH-binding)
MTLMAPPTSAVLRLSIDDVAAAGLRGRGGSGFPTARKLAVPGKLVVANGCEGEPESRKDFQLLSRSPHLVFDGIMLARQAIGATDAVLCVHEGSPLVGRLRQVSREVRVVEVPRRYVASEESALVNFLSTGDARPTLKAPRFHGVLVDNVETLAQLAILARVGPEAFRATETTLVTVVGSGVHEVPVSTRVSHLVSGPVLAGGYGGMWLSPATASFTTVLDAPGVAVFRPLSGCGLRATASMLTFLAGESARQCGPCMFGLPAIATDFTALAHGSREASNRLARRLGVISGRGACRHPDGAVRLAISALEVFAADVHDHLKGARCLA